MDKRKTSWVSLSNCLYFVSSKYEDLKHLESPTFEPFEDLDSAIQVGLSDSSLKLYLVNEWIDSSLENELRSFRIFVEKIESKYWNPTEFDLNQDWHLAREWASSLLEKLHVMTDGWINTSKVIYTK